MVLPLTFLILAVAFTVMFVGLTIFLQGYLYSEPTEKLFLRSLVGGLWISLFLTGWTYINTRAESENKYGTFFEFNPTSSQEINEFDAVRKYLRFNAANEKTGEEKIVTYKRVPGADSGGFRDDANQPFKLNDSTYITVAVIIPNESGEKQERFDAVMKNEWTYDSSNKRFNSINGSRFIETESPGIVYAPSAGSVILAIALNLLLFLVWFIAFWPVLRFSSGHALGLMLCCGVMTMLVLMPLLFRLNTINKGVLQAPPPQTGQVVVE